MDENKTTIDPEKICRRCSRCCHRKEIVRGKLVITNEKCPNLEQDEHGRASCKIYNDRLGKVVVIGDKAVRCILAEEAYSQGLLPRDCPYVYYYQHQDDHPPGSLRKLESYLRFQDSCETQNWDGDTKKPKKNCNHCYGRGYIRKNIVTKEYEKCKCLTWG